MPLIQLYDIADVCKMCGTTSRTLRFYEEKGLIKSTKIDHSSRRKYTNEQLSTIKNVLLLRTLGLSVKVISELQNNGSDLRQIILSRRAEIYAAIESRNREISLLNEALSALEAGKDIFDKDWRHHTVPDDEEIKIIRICTDAILNGNDNVLYNHFSPRLGQYMPKDAFRVVREDSFAPLGDFVSNEIIVADDVIPNKLYCYIRFSKLGLKITYVFHNKKIEGLWFGYYEF